ncbi:hypothetical protein [Methylobacterium nodulans]|uniref:Uncharacterized protein n=1 Tax=Methylobacterium nodulans (strain LMG 21967 / CNCM I-2342 / ORS 2060) TaxID=460265 RepID=B8IAB9_METNO|nr:hypothetical protein [Methylobacterium nodulans]ACL59182.1 conserved hypothetical protein [Methylobacterium nodulans ORS 2060]
MEALETRLYVLQSDLNRAVARSDAKAYALEVMRGNLDALEAKVAGLRRDLAESEEDLIRWRARAETAERRLSELQDSQSEAASSAPCPPPAV